MKCDPPTPAMPMMATGAMVPGLYYHIAHLVDKDEGEIPQPVKGTKPKQFRGRGKPKGKPQEQRQNPPMVKALIDNFEGSFNEIEAKDLNIVNTSFKIIVIIEAYHNKIILNMAIAKNPISREIRQTVIEAEAMAMDLSNSEDVVVVGPTIRITMECISITHMIHIQNNTVLPAVYAVDLTILLSIVTRENMI